MVKVIQAIMLHPKPGYGLADIRRKAEELASAQGVPVGFWFNGELHRTEPSPTEPTERELRRYMPDPHGDSWPFAARPVYRGETLDLGEAKPGETISCVAVVALRELRSTPPSRTRQAVFVFNSQIVLVYRTDEPSDVIARYNPQDPSGHA